MPSHNLIPIETGLNQCIKCSELISVNQSYLQCQTCTKNIHFDCFNNSNSNKKSKPKDSVFNCDQCNQCPICSKKVAKNHKAILCDLCNSFVHIKCNQLSADDYEKFKLHPNLDFTCLHCCRSTFPFTDLNSDQFNICVKKGIILNDDSELLLIPSSEQKAFMDKITNQIKSYKFEINDDDNNDFEEISDCKYYNPEQFKKKKFSSSNSFSMLHLNIHSIERHIEELKVVLEL